MLYVVKVNTVLSITQCLIWCQRSGCSTGTRVMRSDSHEKCTPFREQRNDIQSELEEDSPLKNKFLFRYSNSLSRPLYPPHYQEIITWCDMKVRIFMMFIPYLLQSIHLLAASYFKINKKSVTTSQSRYYWESKVEIDTVEYWIFLLHDMEGNQESENTMSRWSLRVTWFSI